MKAVLTALAKGFGFATCMAAIGGPITWLLFSLAEWLVSCGPVAWFGTWFVIFGLGLSMSVYFGGWPNLKE